MMYTSTRSRMNIQSSEAIAKGIAPDGGLFGPAEFPAFTEEDIQKLIPMDYKDRAAYVLGRYLTDFTADEIAHCVRGAYTGKFDNEDPAPLKEVTPGVNLLELWHGPTCAFKDMALQLLPYLLTVSASKVSSGKTIVILVATSGDTGKAALDGFADVPGTRIIVFYPRDGVSSIQKLQMQTQAGANVAVCGIAGNFDDAQTGVKQIFGSAEIRQFLADKGMDFSSANSIKFGRLVPQIVYYVSAYCDLRKNGRLKAGESFNVAVPTGNFGNILAAEYARRMGIPVEKLICASNCNNVLTDFIQTGTYDRNRPFHTTASPSMDILISSNLERLLYHLYDGCAEAVAELMSRLSGDGRYTVAPDVLAKLQEHFTGYWCSDEDAKETIGTLFREYGYLCDTHTAVAVNACLRYRRESGDAKPCVVVSTASPYKFAPAVLPAVDTEALPQDEFDMLTRLEDVSGVRVPAPLAGLKGRKVLHGDYIEKQNMADFIKSFLEK